jgi:hypothetical protein
MRAADVRASRSIVLIAVLSSACGAPRSEPRPVPSPSASVAIPAPPADAGSLAQAPRNAPSAPSAHLVTQGCKLHGVSPERIGIAYDGSSPKGLFAIVTTPEPIELDLGEPGRAASLTVDVLALRFDAQTPEGGVRLHATRPLALGGVFDPAPETPLLWSGTARGISLGVNAKQILPILGNVPIEAELPCDAASIPVAAFTPRSFPKQKWLAKAIDSFTLSTSPDGVPAATFPVGPIVKVIETRGKALHVVFENGDGVWHGWADAHAFTRETELMGQGFGGGTGVGALTRFPGVECPADIPLFVRKTGSAVPLARVGVVRAGMHVAFAPASNDDAFRVLGPEQRATSDAPGSLMMMKELELVVPSDAADTCTDDMPKKLTREPMPSRAGTK